MIRKPFFPFVLDQKPKLFLNWFLYLLFKQVKFNRNMPDQLRQMQREGAVVYAIKYRGHLDYLLSHYCFRKNRLPYPKIAFDLNMAMFLPLKTLFDIFKFYVSYFFKHKQFPSPFKSGFYKEAIQQGSTFLLCVVNPKGFYKHFIHAEQDQIQCLLETQREMEKPVFIVPQLILYKKATEKERPGLIDILFGYKDNPGSIRKIVLFFRHHRQAFIDFGLPLNLKDYLKDQPPDKPASKMADDINRILIERIDAQKRVILGPVIKSRHQFKEIVLKDEGIVRTIEEISAGDSNKLRQTRKRASAYFDEIAADFNMTYLHFAYKILTWLWKKIFQGIDVDPKELGVVRESARKAPLVYVPSHKSHIDYLVLNYLLFEHHLPAARIAAGRNLAFWPMGHIFRKSGAFFIRRSFKGARLYALVFTRYIKALLQEGDAIEFFIEGGRSRSGKLILPKMGFLSILIEACQEGYCNDLMFVPTSIAYDSVPEQKSYLKEIKGQTKGKEDFKQVLKARKILKRKHGKIYIRFSTPVSLQQYFSEKQDVADNLAQDLALHLVRSINRVTLITPLSIVATAILTKHRRGFYRQELLSTTDLLLASMKKDNAPMSESINLLEDAVNETLSLLTSKKAINLSEDIDEKDSFYRVDEGKILGLDYYKNSIIHGLLPSAFVATSLLTGQEESKTLQKVENDYRFLKNLFKHEFVYDDDNKESNSIRSTLTFFEKASFITTRNDIQTELRLTRLGFDNLQIWAALTKTFLESYWIAARSFIPSVTEETRIKESDLLKNMDQQGRKYLKLGLIDHIEAISHISFKNAIRFINKDVLSTKHESEEKIDPSEKLSNFIQKLFDLSHFTS